MGMYDNYGGGYPPPANHPFYGRQFNYVSCLTQPLPTAIVNAGVVSLLEWGMMGLKPQPQRYGVLVGILYCYGALQCPFEAMQGRPSATHNFMAGGILGAIAVQSGTMGVPFIDQFKQEQLYRQYRWLRPPHLAFATYGAAAFALAALTGKPM